MKIGIGMLIFVLLTGVILGASQPAVLHAASTGGGYVWDAFVDTSPTAWGTKLTGPLSIYYYYTDDTCSVNDSTYYEVLMYITVRLTYKGINYTFSNEPTLAICQLPYNNQWAQVKVFLTTVVGTITNCKSDACWKLKSVNNAAWDTGPDAFVADITIAVKE